MRATIIGAALVAASVAVAPSAGFAQGGTNHPRPRAATGADADVPLVTIGYSRLLDEPCAMLSKQPLDTAFVAAVRAHLPDLDAQWLARGPRLLRTAREIVGVPYQFRETRAALVTCGLPSGSFPLIMNARNFVRLAADSLADERTLFVNTLFHELVHRYVSERLQQLPRGTTPLLEKYAAEHMVVRSHLHLFAILEATYRRLGITEEMERAKSDDRRLANRRHFARAHEIVAAEGAEPFLRELGPAAGR